MKALGRSLKRNFLDLPAPTALRAVLIGFIVVSVGIGGVIGADIPDSILAGALLFSLTGYVAARRARLNRNRTQGTRA